MSKVQSVLKSTGRDLVIAALVMVTIYLLVQVFDRPGLPEPAADPAVAGNCVPGDDAAACAQDPEAPTAPAQQPAGEAPLYVTVTVAE